MLSLNSSPADLEKVIYAYCNSLALFLSFCIQFVYDTVTTHFVCCFTKIIKCN